VRSVTVRDVPITLSGESSYVDWWCDQLSCGSWEADTFDVIDAIQPSTLLDIGAWCGIFSIYATKKYDTKCLAYEPDPVAWQMFTRNLEINGCMGVDARNAAVWTYDGRLELHVHNELGDSMTGVSREGTPVEVDCVSVDTVHELMPDPSMAKIDVEGAEGTIWAPFRDLFSCTVHLSWHRAEAGNVEPPSFPVIGGNWYYPTFGVPVR
jgi:FkbM family methyltransferase